MTFCMKGLQNKNFWRTCYNANLICVNHDKKVHFKKKMETYIYK